MDEKAAVRKAGLQLLEALLMMRAQGAGGADPELPTEQDIRALEAATADALVRTCTQQCIHAHSSLCWHGFLLMPAAMMQCRIRTCMQQTIGDSRPAI